MGARGIDGMGVGETVGGLAMGCDGLGGLVVGGGLSGGVTMMSGSS
jgi:hypothetical protein